MSNEHSPVPVSAFQLKLKQLCVDVENLFECRSSRFEFAQDFFFALALFTVVFHAQEVWLQGKPWPLWALSWLLFGWTAFWAILHIVRRFHDLGRSGGLGVGGRNQEIHGQSRFFEDRAGTAPAKASPASSSASAPRRRFILPPARARCHRAA